MIKLPEEAEIPKIEDMTREDLIETIKAMEDHHRDHHDREEKLGILIGAAAKNKIDKNLLIKHGLINEKTS